MLAERGCPRLRCLHMADASFGDPAAKELAWALGWRAVRHRMWTRVNHDHA
jgi:hypothetical protein